MKTSENLGTYYSPFTILKYDRIVEISQEKSKKKVKIAKRQIQKMLINGEQITVQEIEKATGLSNSFFYRNKEIKAVLDEAKRKQQKPCNSIEIIKAIEAEETIIALKTDIARLEMKLRKAEIHEEKLIIENEKLRQVLKGYEKKGF